jgi:membrane-bound acyltransferase YfiQ involved in biofilm formation
MIIPDLYKPIKNFGILFILVGIIGCCLLLAEKSSGFEYCFLVLFAGPVSLFHIWMGYGLVIKNKKSFLFFKKYLRLLNLGFPIGTYISKITMNYINDNNIEKFVK